MKFITLLQQLLSAKDKQFLVVMLILSIVVSLIETISITALMLFISVATNFETIFKSSYHSWLYTKLSCSHGAQYVIYCGIILAIFYLIRGALSLTHVYIMSRFAYTRYHRFSSLLFARFLRFSYQDFVGKNSAVLSQSIFSYTSTLTQLIFACLTLITEIFTVLCIYGMLFYVNWKMTLALTCFLSLKSLILLKIFSKYIAATGKQTQRYSLETSKIFNESVGNFKLIKLGGYEQTTTEHISITTQGYSRAQILYVTLQNMPRFVLETIGFLLLIFIILYVIYRYHSASFVIPIVSLYALAFYRLLPSLNKILASSNQITFSQHALEGVYNFLQLPTETLGKTNINFNHSIQLEKISFGYDIHKPIVTNISITINKGDRIGFIGPSGSGKSTLVDLIMGLYYAQTGNILIDGIALDQNNRWAWRQHIGYVPQSIYLFDGTVAANVVFGRHYDEQKIIQVLQKVHMYDFLVTQSGITTRVGEGGIKLSGGQKQRIALARALYTNPSLLVLDEATSALDHHTEQKIMDQVYHIDGHVTLIIIAHRTSTVERCNKIFNIEHGQVQLVNFTQIMPQSKEHTV